MLELNVYNHQDAIRLSANLCSRLQVSGRAAVTEVLKIAKHDSNLGKIDEVEINFVDDETIADLHLQFMQIPGPTDVITFSHGEIHISVETARDQARDYANDFERELMLYIVHGLLHLAGYEDATERQSDEMDNMQSTILTRVW
ncbi:MAG: rRNA maturation RNase YbeY [Akkermansiaceae bacterium]|nr:rRNA maturation RNase YbeY [Akkermansiaceae bacterium]